ncbi:hypothetical protein NDU88_003551 [Pleurodeles waltl]|uniref:Uncharacterized protein n=1 Tax=Pleurodeles waltl TaxID=8319 RepID=A0AAV7P9Y4_PLEWA|nr:hypothetical protein NDU88_003550 [Pleurodeles waltl]KAJ1125113.1 hypothetical protein NDU88_003551 [Pleurodeles waltl]
MDMGLSHSSEVDRPRVWKEAAGQGQPESPLLLAPGDPGEDSNGGMVDWGKVEEDLEKEEEKQDHKKEKPPG